MSALDSVRPRPHALPEFAGWGFSTSGDLDVHGPDPIELQSLSSRATERRRREFTIGRLAARRALTAIGAGDRPVLSGLHREPVWPPGLAGSIAHAGGCAIALVAPLNMTDGVGVDVELMDEVPELWGHVPRSEELLWLDKLRSQQRMAALIALFSAKEALYKAFYPRVRRFFGFEAASIRPIEGGYEARFVQPVDEDYPESRPIRVNSRWCGEVVVSWLILPKT